MKSESLNVDRSEAERALRIVASIVFSLDRLGSSLGPNEIGDGLLGYIQEWDVTEQLADARQILSALFEDEIRVGCDESELEVLLNTVPYWTKSNPTIDNAMTKNKVKQIQLEKLKKYHDQEGED